MKQPLTLLRTITCGILTIKVASVGQLEMDKNSLKPPPAKNLRVLDKNAFNKVIKVPCLKIKGESIEKARSALKPFLLKMPHLKPIVTGNEAIVYLHPNKINQFSDIDDEVRDRLATVDIDNNNFHFSTIQLNYDNWNADEILRAILPERLEIIRSYSMVGHIVHLNLRDDHTEFKLIIGEVLLDKIPCARTVVNKTSQIDSTFRNFSMELVCGDDEMVTQVKENGIKYQFDFSKVYWNPRLSTEHQRLVDTLSPGDVLFDIFCGVGPFSIPCAKKKCRVFANDLNPDCYYWLNRNVTSNKVNKDYIETFNKDGIDFIKFDIKRIILNLAQEKEFMGKIHVAMNLPALALEFVQHFKHLFLQEEVSNTDLHRICPVIHIYFFVFGPDPKEAATRDFMSCTGLELSLDLMKYQYVRNVSPQKNMVKITFTPPVKFLVGGREHKSFTECDEPVSKKTCKEL